MAFHSQHHSFDIHLASKYGLEEAIIIHHMQHWIRLNRRKGKNLKEGKCWTFDTMEHISDNFPYLNYEKVKYAIEKLIEYNVLIKGNFNRAGFDKTNWYAFVDEKAFGVDEESSKNLYDRENSPSIGKIPHRGGKIPEPIPDTIRKDAKEKINIKKGRKSDLPSADAQALSDFFLQYIKSKKSDFQPKALDKWANEFDKMLRIDKRHPERIKDVITCLDLKALSFVQSAKKLRDQFDALEMRHMAQLNKAKAEKNRVFFLKARSDYPKEFFNITFNGTEVINIKDNTTIPFFLDYKDFAEAIAKMIGGEVYES